jgi:hypothetical protein
MKATTTGCAFAVWLLLAHGVPLYGQQLDDVGVARNDGSASAGSVRWTRIRYAAPS